MPVINMDTLKIALGDAFDPEGDYVVCSYRDLHFMNSKGYKQVGTVQDSSDADSSMLVFDRHKKETS